MTWPLLLVNPAAVAVVAALGVGGCRVAHVDPRGPALAMATLIALLASAVAVAPLLRGRWSDPAGPSRAALVALVLHLAVTLVLAAAGVLAVGGRADKLAFTGWMLAMYWATLAGVAAAAVRAVSAAAGRRPVA